MTIVAWFSGGVSSAVATKLLVQKVDKIIYTHIDDQHSDTLRFISDCEEWFGKEIQIMQSEKKSVSEACLSAGGRGYINGPAGAACTKQLKRDLRIKWEKEHQKEPIEYIWGLDSNEKHRAERIEKSMPFQEHSFPLIKNKITKSIAHRIMTDSGIRRPKMYDLGYLNNNCIGCVKGGMGYWNKIRVDFPHVFKARAEMEREIQATCIGGVYLDELDPNRGRNAPPIVAECGIICESITMYDTPSLPDDK